jgi:hypothetical protein
VMGLLAFLILVGCKESARNKCVKDCSPYRSAFVWWDSEEACLCATLDPEVWKRKL